MENPNCSCKQLQVMALHLQSLWRIPTAAVSSCRSWPCSCNPCGESLLQLWADTGPGVADGVGGWARRGVDAGEYSRALMANTEAAAAAMAGSSAGGGGRQRSHAAADPAEALRQAWVEVRLKGRGGSLGCGGLLFCCPGLEHAPAGNRLCTGQPFRGSLLEAAF